MTDVVRQMRSSRYAPPSLRALVPRVLATTPLADAPAIAIADHTCDAWSPPKIDKTAPRDRRLVGAGMLVTTVPDPISPYPRLRRCT